MKNPRPWKRPVLLGSALLLLPLAPAWAEQDQPQRTPTQQKVFDAATQKVSYLKQLIQFDESQIALGRLALQQSHEMRVRSLGQNLVDAHTQHLDELSAWAHARSQELSSAAAPAQPQGVGGAGTAGTEGAPALGNEPQGDLPRLASMFDAYAQRADQHRASLRQDDSDLQKETGNSFDRKWLEAVRESGAKGEELVKDGAERFASDAAFATLLGRTDQVIQKNLRAAKQIAPGLQ
jgi:hypothetical protein